MQQLINDLLAYSRVGTRGAEFAADRLRRGAATRPSPTCKLAIEESGAAGRRPTRCRRSWPTAPQLVQLFQNLIGNAIKFRGEEPPASPRVARREGDDEWVFAVRDNGIGIDPQYFERIFVIFQRLHGRDEYPGHRHRPGDLQEDRRAPRRAHLGGVRSPAQGTTFYFTIPDPKEDSR